MLCFARLCLALLGVSFFWHCAFFNISVVALGISICLLFSKKDFRATFVETYRLTKITIPILVLLALVIFGTFYSCADMFVRWRLGFKYRSFLWFLLWLPYFRYDKKAFKFFMGSILVSFFVSYIYTVFFNDNLVPY